LRREGGFGAHVVAVDEDDTSEVWRDPEPAREVDHRAALWNLELGATVATLGWKKCGERGEELDCDLHLNPPCPSDATAEWRVVTRSRSPGRIASRFSSLFQRTTSLTDTPYCLAIELSVSRGTR